MSLSRLPTAMWGSVGWAYRGEEINLAATNLSINSLFVRPVHDQAISVDCFVLV